MSELTARRALEIMSNLWYWKAENPEKSKWDWPGWDELPPSMWRNGEYCMSHCPACEYNAVKKLKCSECLLHDLWAKTACRETKCPGCNSNGTPYQLSFSKDTSVASKAALKIAKFCDKLLEEMDKEG